MNTEQIFNSAQAMKHSPIRNYAGIPGLTSWLVGERSNANGCVRLFECSRNHHEVITPHSHRFDLTCLVLRGYVENKLFVPHADGGSVRADLYEVSSQRKSGEGIGRYSTAPLRREHFLQLTERYDEGDTYSMKADEVHAIRFSKDAVVLFFEGPEVSSDSVILEPVVDGYKLNTFVVPGWAFRKDGAE